jgi:phytoene dehydrogenase-like protein
MGDGSSACDAIVIGSGPNGLAAAVTLARAGRSVLVREAGATVGGSCRSSASLTLGGFIHDICSTVHALALASPFMRSVPLREHGVEFVHPQAPYAHPLDDGTAAVAERSVDETATKLGTDGDAYRALMGPIARDWEKLLPGLLAPPSPFTSHPLAMMRFGLKAIRSARALVEARFRAERARALFAGAAAHAILPLEWAGTAAYGLVLGTSAHAGGWPVVRGGSQVLSDALASYFRSLGGVIETNAPVASLRELPSARAVLCDVTPRQLIAIAGEQMSASYRRRLERFRYGPGAHKVDWALSAPIPWRCADVARAGTVHLGGTFDEIAAAERAPWEGGHAECPYVLLVQPTLFDPTRAPEGKHTAWAYCHVPHGSSLDVTDRIEAQVERFAPGFRDLILARSVMTTDDLQRHNPNLIGGDITGGAQLLRQVFARPVFSTNPYRTPIKGVYLCSSSTPPGGGVHGMCGYHAANSAMGDLW